MKSELMNVKISVNPSSENQDSSFFRDERFHRVPLSRGHAALMLDEIESVITRYASQTQARIKTNFKDKHPNYGKTT